MTEIQFKVNLELTASEPLLEAIRQIARAVTPATSVIASAPASAPAVAEKAPEPTEEAPVAEQEAPLVIPEPAKATGATAEMVREAMKKIRDKFEYGPCAPGETKGPNEERDPKIKKQLTQLFKSIASEIEDGVLPSDLKPENKKLFIERIEGTTLTDEGYVAPF